MQTFQKQKKQNNKKLPTGERPPAYKIYFLFQSSSFILVIVTAQQEMQAIVL